MTTRLLLDLDFKSEGTLLRFIERTWPFIWWFKWPLGQLKLLNLKVMQTKHGWHFYVDVRNKIDDPDIVFLQLAFGSDLKRECYNFERVHSGFTANWNFLFAEKYNANGDLISEERVRSDITNEVFRKVESWQKK